MLDTVIRGGTVVTPWGIGNYNIGIKGERIVAVGTPGDFVTDVGRTIDATGKIVIPGGVEPHAHSSFLSRGKAADVDIISEAAVWGGTTTVCDFALRRGDMDIFQSIEEKQGQWQEQSYSDYALHCLLMGTPPPKVISQIGEVIKAGFPSMKLFTTNIRPAVVPKKYGVDMGRVAHMMEQVAANGGILMVHAEDDEIVMYNHERLQAENRIGFQYLPLVHSKMSEDVSFRRVIRVAQWTNCAVYMVHVSAKEGVGAIEEARAQGLPVYGETLHNYASFTAEDYSRPHGEIYQTFPSLKYDEDRTALWNGLLTGSISCMSTDETCTSFEMKTSGKTIWDVVGGHLGTETRVGITYTEGVVLRTWVEGFKVLSATATPPGSIITLSSIEQCR